MNRNAFAFLGLLAVLPLTGCISLAPKPPARLMTLTAASPLAPGTAITTGDDKAVQIARLGAIPALSTQRVLVTDGPTGIAYLKGGLWAAQPTDLFRGLLAETITARTGRVVTDPRLLPPARGPTRYRAIASPRACPPRPNSPKPSPLRSTRPPIKLQARLRTG